ncbi:MAG: O-antigen ligase family protein [Chloroflexota bacterium]
MDHRINRTGNFWPSTLPGGLARTLLGIDPDFGFAVLLGLPASVFYLAPWPGLYIPALVVLAVLSWRRVDLALPLVIVFAPLFMLPKHLGSKEFAPSEILLLLDVAIVLLWTLRAQTRSRLDLTRLRTPFMAPALLFLFAGLLSTTFAADRHQALQYYREDILEPLLFFGLILVTATRPSRWRLLFAGLLVAGLMAGIVGIAQFATHQDLTVDAGSTLQKVRSVYDSPNNLGLLLDRVIPVWLAIFAGGALLRKRGRWLAWSILGVILLLTLFLTYSRGAWIGVALAVIAIAVLMRRGGKWVALVCIVLAAGVAVAGGPKIKQLVTSGHSNTGQQRLYLWHSSERMILAYPVLGVGPDNFEHYYAPTRKQDLYQRVCAPGVGYMQPQAGSEPCLSHPHNEFLDFWLSTGILGLASFIWLEILFWQTMLASRSSRDLQTRVLTLAASGAMVASLVHGLVDNSYFLQDLSLLFWLLCGYAAYRRWTESRLESRSDASAAKPLPAATR